MTSEAIDVHDERTNRLTGPTDWEIPTPAESYNLVVVGAGTAGLVSAAGAAGMGARVALVERERLGGDCLHHGCVPSKALIRCARAAAEARRAHALGVRVGDVEVDFPAVMERMRRLRAEIALEDSVARFQDLGVDVFLGEGRFVAEDAIEVEDARLAFDRAVIATGARVAAPPIAGLEDAGYLTNESLFSLDERPRRMAVIGGGPIGCEMAQTFARFGTSVTLFELLPRLLPNDDPDAADLVARALLDDGVDLELDAEIVRVEPDGEERTLVVRRDGGSESRFRVDRILVAAGRIPNLEGLALESAGIAYEEGDGIELDDGLRTTNPRVYAAGDVAGRHAFTHVADAHARLVLQNALFPGPSKKVSRLTVPWCTYTDPEVAHVGHTAESAAEAGIEIRTLTRPLHAVDRAVLESQTEGFARIRLRKGGDEIVGATIVASHAGEWISEMTAWIEAGEGLESLASVIHPYPTQAEALGRLADEVRRERLTPLVRWVFERWFAWRRRPGRITPA